MNLVTETFSGFLSLLTGLQITIKQFFSPTITTHYPHQTLTIAKKFRGHIELKWNEETGKPNCTACNICAKACPSDCIVLDGIKPAGEKGKTVTTYHLNYTLCSLCSLCVEACPFDAIQHSNRYNLASVPNSWADMDLVERYKQQVTRVGKTPYDPHAPAAIPASAATPAAAAPTSAVGLDLASSRAVVPPASPAAAPTAQ